MSLNPGLPLLIAAALALVLPLAVRRPVLVAAALASVAAMFAPPFGEHDVFTQLGIRMTPLLLDPLSQTLGLAAAAAAVVVMIAAQARVNRSEDVALCLQAGGAVSAVFAGDLLTYLAAAAIAGFGGIGLVLSTPTPEARAAAMRLSIWQLGAGVGLCLGVGLLGAQGAALPLAPIALEGTASWLIFLGMATLAGGPIAHVWFKDALPQTSTVGGAAMAALSLAPGLVGVARCFAGEPILIGAGLVLALGAAVMAFADSDWRRALAYGLLSHAGLIWAALGVGGLGLAGASALFFAQTLAALILGLAIGAARDLVGPDAASGANGGAGQRMPAMAALATVGALSIAACPGTIGYGARSLAMQSFSSEERALFAIALTAAGAACLAHVGLKLPLAVFLGIGRRRMPGPAPDFSLQLAAGMAAFFVIAVGAAPQWLYALLPPGEVFHAPYTVERIAGQTQLLAVAAALVLLLRPLPLMPGRRPTELLDLDWLWRRPGRRAAAMAGGALLSGYARWSAAFVQWTAKAAAWSEALARAADRPGRPGAIGPAWAALAAAAFGLGLYWASLSG